jgi:hypothetical protein
MQAKMAYMRQYFIGLDSQQKAVPALYFSITYTPVVSYNLPLAPKSYQLTLSKFSMLVK